MNAKTNPELQRDYYQRMKAQGYVKSCVYIPPEKRAELSEIAAKWRKEARRKKGKGDG